jgi:YD repeat-containing protein
VNNGSPTTTGMTVNGWTYYEHVVSGVSSVALTPGTQDGSIDELRLYPRGALMSTFTYLPLVGATTACDANSKITYYVYDGFGRLKVIRDQENNILKSFNYQYKEQQ